MDNHILVSWKEVAPKYGTGYNAWITAAANEMAVINGQRTEMCVQEKPRVCPDWLWKKIIGRVIVSVVEQTGGR